MVDHVVATYTRRSDADRAREQAALAFPDAGVRWGDLEDDLDALVLAQQAEMQGSFAAPAIGVISGSMARGALVWGLVGALVGALAAVPFTWMVTVEGTSTAMVAGYFALTGGIGLASATFVLGAASRSIRDGETTPADPTAVIRVDTDPDHADEVVRFLVGTGARRADPVHGIVRRDRSTMEVPRAMREGGPIGAGDRAKLDAGFRSDLDRAEPRRRRADRHRT